MELVTLPETYVAGMAFRTKNELEANPATGWIGKTWERARDMVNPNPPAAVYTDFESNNAGFYTCVVGFTRKSPKEFEAGEVLTKVPAGQYAKFSATGKLPDCVMAAWGMVWEAESTGKLKRAYKSDLETYRGMEKGMDQITTELYISVQ